MSKENTQFKSPVDATSTLPDIEARLKLLQLQRMEREEQTIHDAEEAQRISRQAGIESVRIKMAMDKAKQDGCNHLKENGRTHLAGQKNHSGVIILICQGCQKIFEGTAPQYLFPTGDSMVGGPH